MKSLKQKDITRDWHLIDAKNRTLGRISTEIAMYLMGKNKAIYSPNLDTGDNVVVINSEKVQLSGKKETQKVYYKHSGYPGGLYSRTASQLRKGKPNDLIINAVYGMLPKTKMGKIMLKKLHVYKTDEHPYKNKIKN
ncbi:MAG: 50S ribosomal protein L13 [Candidatus Curtissbacteria bacterium GW2011_GWA1_40_9]|uniref:Large ribosomal subunit protein uL13 n=1 Tax=Candidatus Curtissbacteria bacterium GW2011_GWA1_40_9 TaxID=1618408 RepID=A0A0G0WRM4_9BACT|nr:MAG: 50S ribosomal protein L13 [Candidatus Curtissbacteria bacterium GW2011_GWA1_40_9]